MRTSRSTTSLDPAGRSVGNQLPFYPSRYGCLGTWLAAYGVLALVTGWIRRRDAVVPGC